MKLMKKIYIYPYNQEMSTMLSELYHVPIDHVQREKEMMILSADSLDAMDDMDDVISNMVLDFNLNIKVLVMPCEHLESVDDVLTFLKEQRLGNYTIGDYFLYCLAFQKDENFIANVGNKIKELDNELRNVLKVYLLNNGNTMKSSKDLHLHRNTVMYRLHKMETLLDLNLSDIKTIHSLSFLFIKLKV